MFNKQIKNICIVGGGSAGWITAAYALEQLPWANITLIESPNIPTVGVGEATLLNFDHFLSFDCKIPVNEWQEASDAVVKAGIFFPKWVDGDKDVWHPFTFTGSWFEEEKEFYPRSVLGVQANIDHADFVQFATDWYITCVEKKQLPDLRMHSVGYHVDAIKLANFLSAYLRKTHPQRLTHILGNVSNIVADTEIRSFDVDGKPFQADFYIDCTGFRRALSSSIPGSEIVVADKMLFANAAVAGPVRYETEDEVIPPYTICQACEHGWMWKTSIATRIGSGLVYNDTLISKEEAEEFFVNHWGKERMLTDKFNHIKFKPEYNRRNWRGNCFSVGLASGFLEPLESTGLHLMIRAAKVGLDMLRKRYYTETDLEYFNSDLNLLYEDSINFVALHYMNNNRPGPFWDKVRTEFTPSESLKVQIETFENDYVRTADQQVTKMFSADSLRIWLEATKHKIVVPENPHAMDALAQLSKLEMAKNNFTNRDFVAQRKQELGKV
jgi:tryptophan halogenase